MVLGFVFDTKFKKIKNDYYSVNLSAQTLSDRYLNVFDKMYVVCRYEELDQIPDGRLLKSNNDSIIFKATDNVTIGKRIFGFFKKNKILNDTLKNCDFVICRGWRGTQIARKLKKPYMVEVVNCAWDSYWNHSIQGKIVAPLIYLLRVYSTYNAPYVQYVTSEFLQKRYPTKGISIAVSDVSLQSDDSSEVLKRRLTKINNKSTDEKIIIGTAGAVNVKFKGQRFIIKALAKLKKQGIVNFEYQIAGGGDNTKLMNLVKRLHIEDQIVFCGNIVHDKIFNWFDSLDIYIQPSLQEGLPRALIEAMSRGLPCYGTRTGGIPELIKSTYVCNNNKGLETKFAEFLKNHTKEKALLMAQENYSKAKEFNADYLKQKFEDFLMNITSNIQI